MLAKNDKSAMVKLLPAMNFEFSRNPSIAVKTVAILSLAVWVISLEPSRKIGTCTEQISS